MIRLIRNCIKKKLYKFVVDDDSMVGDRVVAGVKDKATPAKLLKEPSVDLQVSGI